MKNKFIGILLLGSLSFSSCVKQSLNQASSAVYTVRSSDWVTTNGSVSYSVVLPVPELTNSILQNGAVDVYISFDNGVNYETVPEVYQGIAYGSVQQYQTVIVDLHALNGGTITAPGGTILAKVVLINAAPLQ